MKQKTLLGVFAFSTIAILGLGVVSAFGLGHGFMNHDLTQEDRTEMQTQMQEMKTAIENNDYDTWKSLMEEQITRMQAQITEDNFNEIVAMHQEMQEQKQACEEDEDSCPMHKEGFGPRGHFGMMQPPETENSSE